VLLGVTIPLISLWLRPGYLVALAIGLGLVYLLAAQLAFNAGTILTVVYPLVALAVAMVGALAVDLMLERRHREAMESSVGISEFFVCYRRDQSSWPARILRDQLAKRFGEQNVFMDVDSIDAGIEWPDRISEAVRSSGAVLVLIGPNWLNACDRDGARRLDNPNDWVRLEIEAALADHRIATVPVLIDGASMPAREELPESIRGLADHNSIALRAEQLDNAINQLLSSIERGRLRQRYAAAPRLTGLPK
jgi:hypothetical protein